MNEQYLTTQLILNITLVMVVVIFATKCIKSTMVGISNKIESLNTDRIENIADRCMQMFGFVILQNIMVLFLLLFKI